MRKHFYYLAFFFVIFITQFQYKLFLIFTYIETFQRINEKTFLLFNNFFVIIIFLQFFSILFPPQTAILAVYTEVRNVYYQYLLSITLEAELTFIKIQWALEIRVLHTNYSILTESYEKVDYFQVISWSTVCLLTIFHSSSLFSNISYFGLPKVCNKNVV